MYISKLLTRSNLPIRPAHSFLVLFSFQGSCLRLPLLTTCTVYYNFISESSTFLNFFRLIQWLSPDGLFIIPVFMPFGNPLTQVYLKFCLPLRCGRQIMTYFSTLYLKLSMVGRKSEPPSWASAANKDCMIIAHSRRFFCNLQPYS